MKKELVKLKKELHTELTTNILPFWMYQAIDLRHGGFLGHIDFSGEADPMAPKGGILNARILWTFSAAYNYTKNTKYLEIADNVFKYFIKYFIDKNNGGVYWEVDVNGKPTNTRKQAYAQGFAIYGLS